jgi:transcriptional regulator with XRE-family HTH domain
MGGFRGGEFRLGLLEQCISAVGGSWLKKRALRSSPKQKPYTKKALTLKSLTLQPLAIATSIGSQVRNLRHELDLTVAELADQASLSTSMLYKIEKGAVSASIDSLEALARALNVPLTTFFASYEEQRDCSHVRAGQGVTIERRGTKAGHQYQLLGHSISGEVVVEPYLITLTQEAKPYTMFQHAGVEFIYMLTGNVLYRHADKAYPLVPGDALFFDAAALHGPEELTKLPMTYLSIIIYPKS